MHIVLSHCRRFKAAVPVFGEHERYTWNLAGDLVIQQLLAQHFGMHEPKGIVRIDGCIPNTKVSYLSIPGLTRSMSIEQYFGLLLPHVPQQPGKDGDNPIDPANAGSNSDGQPKPYEKPMDVIDHAMAEHALREVEKRLEKENTSKGTMAGSIKKAIDARLHPQKDPFDQLKSVVARSVKSPLGVEEYYYSVINRHQQADMPRRRGPIRLAPECSIIIDTSGSMSGYESKALTAIAQGLRRVQRPRVIAYDTKVQQAKRISAVKEFEFKGYGGTRMERAIEDEDKQHRPDAIVIVTDGETSWPAKRTRAKLIVALVKKCGSPPPKWATVIDLTREVPRYES
jgi:predicted metal-dependent peptidase